MHFVVLSLFGGVYFDVDMMWLDDLYPLASKYEFSYKWSFVDNFNTAIIAFRKNSALAVQVSRRMIELNDYHPMTFGKVLKDIPNAKFYRLSPSVFDPLWLVSDGKESRPTQWKMLTLSDAFKSSSPDIIHQYDGALAYHWHNQWQSEIQAGSYIGRYEAMFDGFLNCTRENNFRELYLNCQ